MLTDGTVRIRLRVLALPPLAMLVTVIAIASLLDTSFQGLFNNRMKPTSQPKLVADAIAAGVPTRRERRLASSPRATRRYPRQGKNRPPPRRGQPEHRLAQSQRTR